jgi:hypothetical protein
MPLNKNSAALASRRRLDPNQDHNSPWYGDCINAIAVPKKKESN